MLRAETWELLSYVVTVVGLPFGIAVFIYEQRRARRNEEEEVYQELSDEYAEFLKLCLANSDLQLRSRRPVGQLTTEQEERKLVLFDILISLFERAYLLVYEEQMNAQQTRLWKSWEDYMREWCRRADFRAQLPEMLRGEDPDFAAYISRLATEEQAPRPATGAGT
jgi:hypothetical protein